MEIFDSLTYKIIQQLYPDKRMFLTELEKNLGSQYHSKISGELKAMAKNGYLLFEKENKPRGRHYYKINPKYLSVTANLINLDKDLND